MKKSKYILACESSCDETAFCIYDINNNSIIASVIKSQITIHEFNGGVIPELASKLHFNIISQLLNDILKKTSFVLEDIDYFACTSGPGLPGALLIGFTFMKTLAWSLKKPFIPINHLEGHLFSPFLDNPNIEFPHLCMSISGGHSHIYLVENFNQYLLLGKTRDDACGECFDKIAKLLNLPYPGGKYIESIAKKNNFENIRNYTISDLNDGSISFSGLKTAVLYDLMKNNYYDTNEKCIFKTTPIYFIDSVATSVQYVISNMLLSWISYFLKKNNSIKAITIVGGVACNNIITNDIKEYCILQKINFYKPSQKFCCDNADMIAFVASKKIQSNITNHYNQNIFV